MRDARPALPSTVGMGWRHQTAAQYPLLAPQAGDRLPNNMLFKRHEARVLNRAIASESLQYATGIEISAFYVSCPTSVSVGASET